MKNNLFVIFFSFFLFTKSQTNNSNFFTDIRIGNFNAEYNNYQKVKINNSPRLSYQIGIGVSKIFNPYYFTSAFNFGLERISFKVIYDSSILPYKHTISYPNFNQLFSFGLLLNKTNSFQFNYRLCFNGGGAFSNSYPDTIPNIDENITFKSASNFIDNRIGIQINKLLKKRIYAIYFSCEASLNQRELNLKFNNNYFSETKSYTVSYQFINFNIGFIIDNLFEKCQSINLPK